MARLIGPDESSRKVETIDSLSRAFRSKAGRPATFYTDAAATQLANVLTYPAGAAIAGSTATIDTHSMLPLIQFPDGVDTLYVVVDSGPAWPVYARTDDRIDGLGTQITALDVRVTAVEGGDAAAAFQTTGFGFSGQLVAGAGQLRWYNRTGFDIEVVGAWAAVGTAPTGANAIFDVNRNGTTIFTTQGNRPTITAGTRGGDMSATPNVTTVADGQYLSVDIDQVGSTIAGADATVGVVYQLTVPSVPPPDTSRHNLAANPALKNNNTGWSGGSIPTRVTNLPTGGGEFPRATGAHYSEAGSGGFANIFQSLVSASPGLAYSASFYIRPVGLTVNSATLYMVFQRSAGGDDFSHTISVGPLTANAVARVQMPNITSPANTTGIYLTLDGIAFAVVPCDMSAVLIEQSTTVGSYFDGDTTDATWDGVDGNSASTL